MKKILQKSGLVFNKEHQIWTNSKKTDFQYSDGDEPENYVLETVRKVSDVSVVSEELKAQIKDWPSKYHLSRRRSNLLRLFGDWFKGKTILEIGAGCGAITRFLGECGATVVAVEGSLRRAQIARERCRDLNNVHVVCSTGEKFASAGNFDAVLLIGVLEYAKKYGGPEGHKKLLKHCRQQVKKDGALFIAIENQLGLKYLAGAPEDHVGHRMFGINDAYDTEGVCTYGREELQALITEAGFNSTDLYLPYPDYKLPVSLFAPKSYTEFSQQLSGIAPEIVHLEPQPFGVNTFSMEQATKLAWKNGIAPDLSSSFLFVTSPAEKIPQVTKSDIVVELYNDARNLGFNKKTTIRTTKENPSTLEVQATALDAKEIQIASETLELHLPYQDAFHEGQTLWAEFVTIINKPYWHPDQFLPVAKDWLDTLVAQNKLPEPITKETEISGKNWDLTPFNTIRKKDGTIVFIDKEWAHKETLSLGYVVFRGILNSFARITSIADSSTPEITGYYSLTLYVMDKLGLSITDEHAVNYLAQEIRAIGSILTGYNRATPEEVHVGAKNVAFSKRIYSEYQALLNHINIKNQENQDLIHRVHQSEQALAVRQSEIEQAQGTIAHLTQQIEASQQQLAGFEANFQGQAQELTFFKTAHHELSQRIEGLQHELHAAHASLTNLTHEHEVAKITNQDLMQKWADSQNNLHMTNANLQNLTEAHEGVKKANRDLTKKWESTTKELDTAKLTAALATKEVEYTKNTAQDLTLKLERAQTEFTTAMISLALSIKDAEHANASNRDLQAQLHYFQAEHQKNLVNIQALASSQENLNTQLVETNQRYEHERNHNHVLHEQIAQLQSEHSATCLSLANQTAENENQKNTNVELTTKTQELSTELAQKTQNLHDSETAHEALKNAYEQLQAELADVTSTLTAEKDKTQAELDDKITSLKTLQQDHTQLQNSHLLATEQINQLRNEMAELNQKLNDNIESLSKEQKDHEQLQKAHQSATQQIVKLQSEMTELNQKLNENIKSLSKEQKDHEQLQKAHQTATQQIAKLQSEMAELNQKLNEYKESLNKEQKDHAQLQKAHQTATQQITKLQSEMTELSQQHKQEKEQSASLRKAQTELEKQLASLSENLGENAQENILIKNENQALTQRLSELQTELELSRESKVLKFIRNNANKLRGNQDERKAG